MSIENPFNNPMPPQEEVPQPKKPVLARDHARLETESRTNIEGESIMWYHGSKVLVPTLERRKAWGPPGTPKEESLNMIYFTPDFAFALVSAARPEGMTEVDHKGRTVHFENPDKFEPEKEIYIYMVDPSKIPDDKKIYIDEWQNAVNLDEVKPDKVERHKASEVSRYYNIIP